VTAGNAFSVEHIFEKEVYFSKKLCYNTPRMRRVGQSRAKKIKKISGHFPHIRHTGLKNVTSGCLLCYGFLAAF
jgi:hypothetical protein